MHGMSETADLGPRLPVCDRAHGRGRLPDDVLLRALAAGDGDARDRARPVHARGPRGGRRARRRRASRCRGGSIPRRRAQARAMLRPRPKSTYSAAPPRHAAGDRVTVIRLLPSGHTRCPGYLRGASRRRRAGARADAASGRVRVRGRARAARGVVHRRVRRRPTCGGSTGPATPSSSTCGKAIWRPNERAAPPRTSQVAAGAPRRGARDGPDREGARLDRRRRRGGGRVRARDRPAERRPHGGAGVGRPRLPQPAARRRRGRGRRARLRRHRGRPHARRREHARRAQRDRVHALLVLPVARARHPAGLVQEPALPRPRRARAARGAGRVRPRAGRRRRDPGVGLERRPALHRPADAAGGHRRHERGRAGRRSSPATA